MLDVCDRLIEQLADVLVVQRIDDLAALAPASHQPEMAQEAKLMGDGRGFHAYVPRQFAHRAGRGVKAAEDAQSTRRRECLHSVGDHLGKVLIQRVRLDLCVSVGDG